MTYNTRDPNSNKIKVILVNEMQIDENKFCQECFSRGPHTWASWNLGVFLCIRCAGIHRKLGVHISKVKSCTLDSWTLPQVESLVSKGNQQTWDYYEHALPNNYPRPKDTNTIEMFIRNKYERKLYVNTDGSVPLPGEQPRDQRNESAVSENKKSILAEKKTKQQPDKKKHKKVTIVTPAEEIPRPISQPIMESHTTVNNNNDKNNNNNNDNDMDLLIDIGSSGNSGLSIKSSSNSELSSLTNIEALFDIKPAIKPTTTTTPTTTNNNAVNGINSPINDFLQPIQDTISAPRLDTNQIMALYSQQPRQAGYGYMGVAHSQQQQQQYYQYQKALANQKLQQQQHNLYIANQVNDVQKHINSLRLGGPNTATTTTNTSSNSSSSNNDPWSAIMNGANTNTTTANTLGVGQTLSHDLWM